MLIAICDDEAILCKDLQERLYKYSKQHSIELVVEIFYDGNDLLDCKQQFDVVFLDYQMPNIDGIQTAKKIRETNSQCTIIFLTNYPEIVYDTFTVETFRFLIKPIDNKKLNEALDSYCRKIDFYYPITVNVDGDIHKINTRDIIYIEADGKNSIIRLNNGCFHSPKTLAAVYELLPKKCFFKTHRSYVVNYGYIEKYNKKSIKFTNGEYAKISRNSYMNFKNALNIFLKDSVI